MTTKKQTIFGYKLQALMLGGGIAAAFTATIYGSDGKQASTSSHGARVHQLACAPGTARRLELNSACSDCTRCQAISCS